jgi:beta-phosphoglucomutase-like phosphatase (HAD superfamily)
MAIITTSRRVDFDLIHKNRGIVDFMDFTLCVEEYKRAKPYPDPYLAGLRKFNATKKETIVVENEFTKSHDFSKANYFIKNLKELRTIL